MSATSWYACPWRSILQACKQWSDSGAVVNGRRNGSGGGGPMRNGKTHIIWMGGGRMRDLRQNWYTVDIPITFFMVLLYWTIVLWFYYRSIASESQALAEPVRDLNEPRKVKTVWPTVILPYCLFPVNNNIIVLDRNISAQFHKCWSIDWYIVPKSKVLNENMIVDVVPENEVMKLYVILKMH